jgi:hypothetical protein
MADAAERCNIQPAFRLPSGGCFNDSKLQSQEEIYERPIELITLSQSLQVVS